MRDDDARAIQPLGQNDVTPRSLGFRNPRVIRGLARIESFIDTAVDPPPTTRTEGDFITVEFPADEFERGFFWYLDDSNQWIPLDFAKGSIKLPVGSPLRFQSPEFSGSDADLGVLSRVETIESLFLEGTEITDVGIDQLRNIPLLNSLTLVDTAVTDASLSVLCNLANLRKLALWSNPAITDEGLVVLRSLSSLTHLRLWPDTSTPWFTDDGIYHLNNLAKLEFLDLSENRITDDGLRCLRNKKDLVYLGLSSTPIIGAGLGYLGSLENLKYLDLSGTDVSDTCIESLAQVRSLRMVNLEGTQISNIGRTMLLTCTPKTGPAIMGVLHSTKGDFHAQESLQRRTDHRHSPGA